MRAHFFLFAIAALATLPACSAPNGNDQPDAGRGSEIDANGSDAGSSRADMGTPVVDATMPGADAATTGDMGGLGTCAGGCGSSFTCGASGYCVSATGVPEFDHVYVVIFENRSRTSVIGQSAAPYLNGLLATSASASNYISVDHPSLPNYIAMTSGDTQGIGCDCSPGTGNDCTTFNCGLGGLLSRCTCEQPVTHLGDQLDAASLTWRTYGEGMGTPCNTMDAAASHYAARHLPFLYYTNVLSDRARCTERVRDFSDFLGDMGMYRFSMISPNLCSDMHDTCGGSAVAHGDTWASANLTPIVTAVNASTNDVLFIVWDEEDNSLGAAPLPFIVVSPLAHAGSVSATRYDHYSLLATWQDGLGLTPRLGMAAGATPIADIWR